VIVTTSWDDGHPADERVLDMLAERGLRGTFYIPRQHPMCGTVSVALVRKLHDSGAEIGAHSMTHPNLCQLSERAALSEVQVSKEWLEEVTGSSVPLFAYPFGKHNLQVCRVVMEAGYQAARSLRYNHLRRQREPFRMGITAQAADASPLLVTRTWLDVRGSLRQLIDWPTRAIRAFDVASARDGVWHLWGHSWEIERNGDWPRLATVLDYIANKPGVRYLTNGDALKWS
jgi:peptidoglycan/xylan/chitin deacetylase (PgdA/CDA1 family)